MRGVGRRWAILSLVAAVAIASGTVLAADSKTVYKTEPTTACWPCHQAQQGSSPALKTFVNLLPPPEAGAGQGTPFDYIVQIQNAWSADLLYLEPTLDLTKAPSLSFVSDVPPFNEVLFGNITLPADPTQINQPQDSAQILNVPVGETEMWLNLTPQDTTPAGPFLKLKVYGESHDVNGTPDAHAESDTRGGTASLHLPDRAAFQGVGWGNWTVVAEATYLPANPTDNFTLITGQSIPYSIQADAHATATLDRAISLPITAPVLKGGSTSAHFALVATATPADGEVVGLTINGEAHYKHKEPATDYDNFTKAFAGQLAVRSQGSRVTVTAPDAGTSIIVPSFQNGATMATVSEVVGYASAFLLISSIWTGGMFGKASRRQLNVVFGSAKRRVAFHNFLSYGILAAAAVHMTLFLIENTYYWTLGIIWGGLAILAMLLLGVTGAFQVQMIRKWSYGFWRWSHYGLAVAAIVFTLLHGMLDGVHFGFIQKALHWKDPLDPRHLTA